MRLYLTLLCLVLPWASPSLLHAQEASADFKALEAAVKKLNGSVYRNTSDKNRPMVRLYLPSPKDGDLESLRPLLVKLGDAFEISLSDSITDAGLAHLAGLKNLVHLEINSPKVTDAGMANLKDMPEITDLRLQVSKVTKAGFLHLGSLKKLQKLTITRCAGLNAEGMAGLKGLSELGELAILYSNTTTANGAVHLTGLKKLKRLHLSDVADEAFKHVGALTSLEQVHLSYSGIGDAGVAHLASLTNLELLDLYATHVTDEGLVSLSKLSNLRDLKLIKTRVGDQGLKNLGSLPKLKVIWLTDTKVTDAGLVHLKNMTALEAIWLEECAINGPGLEHLTGLGKLQRLSFVSSKLTDAAMPHLKSMKGLKEVRMVGTRVSCDEAFALHKAIPNARVVDAFGDEFYDGKRPEDLPPTKFNFDVAKIPTAAKLSAKEFHDLLKKDRDATLAKFDDKALELTGVIQSVVGNGQMGYVRLDVGDPYNSIGCGTSDLKPWTKLAPGMTVKMKGKIAQRSYGDQLIACITLEASAYPANPITAEQLAKEFKADAEAAKKKYDKKQLVVTGEIVDRKIAGGGFVTFYLKGDGDSRVECAIQPHGKYYEIRRWNIGQQVRLVGQFELGFDPKEARINNCLPLGAK
jgi:tRNA_anti-like/Leucine Rich repeat